MNTPRAGTSPASAPTEDALAGARLDGSAIADLAFGDVDAGRSRWAGRHLALLNMETLELDLTDPSQRQFGDYELLEQIGEGGMGVVYRAHQASLDREVAIKLLAAGPWASKEFIERFRREAQNAARMQHPNIVAIHEVGCVEELHFFSMRLVHGGSLATVLERERRLMPLHAARLLRVVAEAVDYAHRLGVLHLDLKPANVLLDENGAPHVADFGLARRLDNALATDSEEISGTPSYMAPEQAEVHAHKISAATDIWGLGAILYELLTGQPPFRAQSTQETIRLVREGHVRAPRRQVPKIPRDLEAIVLKCLEREPGERYASARALADDLGRFIERRAVQARPLNVAQRLGRWTRREPKLALSSGLAVLALLAGLAATTQQWRRADANADRAMRVRSFLVGVFEEADPEENDGQPITAEQLLERGESEVATITADEPAMRADLASVIGILYWYVGNYRRSEPLLREALAIISSSDVPDQVKVDVLLAVAFTEKEKNHYDQAMAHARLAITYSHQARADKSTDVASALRLIGECLIGTGKAQAAQPLLREVLDADLRRNGNADKAIISDYSLLADALYEMSHFDDSISAARKAIELAAKANGRNRGTMIGPLETLASAQRASGRLSDAERSLGEAVSIATQVYGAEHRETIVARSNLLITVAAEGRFADALSGHLALLRTVRKFADKRPEQLAYTYNAIAADDLGLGDFAAAEGAARKALQVWARINPEGGAWDSADAIGNLAIALQWQGRYADAEREFRRQIAIEQASEPPSSGWLNRDRGNLGDLLRRMRRYPEALAELRGALHALPMDDTPVRAGVLAKLGAAETETGNPRSGRALADEALSIMRKVVPRGSPQLEVILLSDAQARLALGDAGSAEGMLREALTSSSALKPGDPRVIEIKTALMRALAAQNKNNEARRLRSGIEPALDASTASHAPALRTALHESNKSPD